MFFYQMPPKNNRGPRYMSQTSMIIVQNYVMQRLVVLWAELANGLSCAPHL